MNTVLTFIFGAISGVVGGMGMGGGTLLIPLLGLLNADQHAAQAANLIGFIPMCLVALSIHSKNNLVKCSGTGWLTLFAAVGSVVGSLIAGSTSPDTLRSCFGILLTLLGLCAFFKALSHIRAKLQNGNNDK